MGKAARWFRAILGIKKEDSPPQPPATKTRLEPKPAKKRWSFVKSYREKDGTTKNNTGDHRRASYGDAISHTSVSYADDDSGVDPNRHAIAVAAATAAVAEAAVAAARAAEAVVRLTSSGRSTGTTNTAAHVSGTTSTAAYVSSLNCGVREVWAAVKIQSHFRAYLSRRALRALKALVKLQALFRGHIVRKQTADMLRHLQALLRAQSRARAGRAQVSESPHSSSKSSQFFHPGPATPEKFEHAIKSTKHDQSLMRKRNRSKSNGRLIIDQEKTFNGWNWLDEGSREKTESSMKTGPIDDERIDKILEIDNGKQHFAPKSRNHFQSSHHAYASDQNSHSFTTSKDSTNRHTVPSPSSCEVQSLSPLKLPQDVEECSFCTADNSPQFYSASSRGGSSRKGPFTPTKSDGSRSYLSGYSDHPNYMACTESSRAKVRSLSAPKQRPQFERRYSVHGYGDSRSTTQMISALHANFTSKAYPGSGRLDRLGMPVRSDANSYNTGHWNRY